MICVSCHKVLVSEDNFARFKCPACGDVEIIRCGTCRVKGVLYQCSCGFEGP